MSSAPEVEGYANRSIISGEFEAREQSAPGFQTRGNDSMLGNDRGFDQDPYHGNSQLPSYKNIRSGENSLVAAGSTNELGTTEYRSGPGFDAVGPQHTSSVTSSHTTSYNKAPEFSANLHQNTSATATASATTTTTPTPVNPLDYVGISLVGRRFKAVNPDAYYVEKNED